MRRPVYLGTHTQPQASVLRCFAALSPSPHGRIVVDEEAESFQAENASLIKENHDLQVKNAKLLEDLKKTRAELKARSHREGKLITKIFQLESVIVVLRHQRDKAQTAGLEQYEHAHAARHLLYGEPQPFDALAVAPFRSAHKPNMGTNIEDLMLADLSDYMDDDKDFDGWD